MEPQTNYRIAQHVRCPHCDKHLLKCSAESTVEIFCRTCRRILVIRFENGNLVIGDDRRQNKNRSPKQVYV